MEPGPGDRAYQNNSSVQGIDVFLDLRSPPSATAHPLHAWRRCNAAGIRSSTESLLGSDSPARPSSVMIYDYKGGQKDRTVRRGMEKQKRGRPLAARVQRLECRSPLAQEGRNERLGVSLPGLRKLPRSYERAGRRSPQDIKPLPRGVSIGGTPATIRPSNVIPLG